MINFIFYSSILFVRSSNVLNKSFLFFKVPLDRTSMVEYILHKYNFLQLAKYLFLKNNCFWRFQSNVCQNYVFHDFVFLLFSIHNAILIDIQWILITHVGFCSGTNWILNWSWVGKFIGIGIKVQTNTESIICRRICLYFFLLMK